jgi:hypothetical protein
MRVSVHAYMHEQEAKFLAIGIYFIWFILKGR